MRTFLRVVALAVVLCAARTGWSGDAEKREKYIALEREIHQSFQEKKYDVAEKKCREQLALAANSPGAEYNLACALARQGKSADALSALSSAIEHGYEDAAHMKEDDDLASLRAETKFGELAALALDKEKNGNYEKGAEMKGVKTIENYPDGGLRYRLRMGEDATAAKPNKLVIWLHPSGGSMNNVAESLAPQLIAHGYALLVMTKKNWMGWNGEDAQKLLNKTLPEVAKIPGIKAEKPVLLGYSAGGQIALQLWESNGAKFGGLVLDAAYPIDMASYAKGQAAAMALPKDESTRKVPMFVLVGGADGGSRIWKQCEEPWRKGGVPLTIQYIEGKGHTWLFGKAEVDALLKWLDGV
jgi:predicted esterase